MSFFKRVGDIFVDGLDQYTEASISDQFTESSTERAEGVTEYGNPGTVSQPVYRSELPSGQPVVMGGLPTQTWVLVGGGVLVSIALTFLLVRK